MLGSHSTTTQREKKFFGGQGEEKYWPVKMRDEMVLRTFRVGYELNTYDTLRESPVKI